MNDSGCLRTTRLLLRPFVESDLNHVFKGLSLPEVVRYYGVNYQTLEDTRRQMEFFADLEQNGTGRWWAVCSPDNNTFYGAGGLNGLVAEHKKAEIGFWLLPAYWGMGFMNEALQRICAYGFEVLTLHRLEAFVESENTNCIHAVKKLGFRHEGTMRECEIKDGKWISLDIFSLLQNDGVVQTQNG
jgi:ribosomal-protein-alanine N-acetyltransferase